MKGHLINKSYQKHLTVDSTTIISEAFLLKNYLILILPALLYFNGLVSTFHNINVLIDPSSLSSSYSSTIQKETV